MLTGVTFTFPTNTTIAGFGSVILISQPSAFPPPHPIFRSAGSAGLPIHGSLDNSGEDVKLGMPLPPVGVTVPYMLVDKVKYGDSTPAGAVRRRWPQFAADATVDLWQHPVDGRPDRFTAIQAS